MILNLQNGLMVNTLMKKLGFDRNNIQYLQNAFFCAWNE